MSLADVLPADALQEMFDDLRFERFGRGDLPEITRRKGSTMHGMGLSIWDRIASFGPDRVDPGAIGRYVDEGDVHLCRRVSNLLGKTVLLDVFYAHVTRQGETVAEMLVGHTYPDVLHVADIEFSNPLEPIPEEEKRFPFTTHRGLGLLGPFFARVEAVAERLGCQVITLTAASADHVSLFRRHGFEISDTIAGKVARENLGFEGLSYPMEKSLA